MMKRKSSTNLVPFDEREKYFEDWYAEACYYGRLVGYYPVHGCDVLLDTTIQIWDILKDFFDREMKLLKVKRCLFPLLLEGDSSSDVMMKSMHPFFEQKVHCALDLPLKVNQWYNIAATPDPTNPIPFFKSREFLCQQGHSAFATSEEAYADVLDIMDLYLDIYQDFLAIPVMRGRMSVGKKLSSSPFSTTAQVFIPETGVGLGGAFSECLGQELAGSLQISFETEVGLAQSLAWQNSWEFNTTAIGLMVMIHGDENGLVLPPKVAPVQAVVIPKTPPKVVLKKLSEACADVNAALEAATIRSEGGLKRLSEAADSLLRSSEAAGIISEIEIKRLSKAFAAATAKAPHIRSERPEVERESEACAAAASALEAAGIRTEVDQLGDIPLSCKIAHWMGKGVPLIVLVNDPDSDSVRIVRRTDGKKKVVPKIELASEARLLLDVMQDEMLRFAKKKRDACVKMVHTWEDFELGLTSKKLLLAPWCDEAGVGKEIEDRTNGVAKIFCTPFTQPELPPGTRCFATGKLARVWSYWSR